MSKKKLIFTQISFSSSFSLGNIPPLITKTLFLLLFQLLKVSIVLKIFVFSELVILATNFNFLLLLLLFIVCTFYVSNLLSFWCV